MKIYQIEPLKKEAIENAISFLRVALSARTEKRFNDDLIFVARYLSPLGFVFHNYLELKKDL